MVSVEKDDTCKDYSKEKRFLTNFHHEHFSCLNCNKKKSTFCFVIKILAYQNVVRLFLRIIRKVIDKNIIAIIGVENVKPGISCSDGVPSTES